MGASAQLLWDHLVAPTPGSGAEKCAPLEVVILQSSGPVISYDNLSVCPKRCSYVKNLERKSFFLDFTGGPPKPSQVSL